MDNKYFLCRCGYNGPKPLSGKDNPPKCPKCRAQIDVIYYLNKEKENKNRKGG